jgi:hypothetical protein
MTNFEINCSLTDILLRKHTCITWNEMIITWKETIITWNEMNINCYVLLTVLFNIVI